MKSYALPFLAVLVGVAAGDGRVPPPQDYVPVTKAAASLEKRACAADNCLRAVRASTRLGSADCSSYVVTTITPATSTVYQTLSFYISPTTTQDATVTTTLAVTATETDEETLTAAMVTTTQEVPVPPAARKLRRQQGAIPNAIPCYASACSGAVRYSSACSCIGVTARTTYAPTPVTTVIVSSTYTATTVTDLNTVQTETVTTTVATETVTTTDATVAPVATVSMEGPFYIQVEAGGDELLFMYVENSFSPDPPHSEYSTVNFQGETTNEASTFYIDGSGYIRPFNGPRDDLYFSYSDNGSPNMVYEWSYADAVAFGLALMHCSVTPGTNVLACGSESTQGANTWCADGDTGYFGAAWDSDCGNPLVLVAVPAS